VTQGLADQSRCDVDDPEIRLLTGLLLAIADVAHREWIGRDATTTLGAAVDVAIDLAIRSMPS
jgi:hypothetical protein